MVCILPREFSPSGWQTRLCAAELEAELEAELRARRAGDGVAIEANLPGIQAGPVFTPMTVSPEILNRNEVQQALIRLYPSILRDAGIGGRVVVWFYMSETGQVLDSRISESSGQVALDEAALRVADVFQFTPAMNRGEPVSVWIQLPITFAVQN